MTRTSTPWFLGTLLLGSFALGCETGGVGDPCTPEDEYQPNFPGYSADEVNVESRSFQCETRVCLVNHFQGRVSCPYGQTETEIASLNPNDPARCRIPGTSGEDPNDAITAAVLPQFVERQADRAVYCSCRCRNAQGSTDDGAQYCECPSGFTCEKLLDDLGLGSPELAGSYCIKNGTKYDKAAASSECSPALVNCGGNGKNPPYDK